MRADRARALSLKRWRCPPLSRAPFSPITVATPSGRASSSGPSRAARAASRTRSKIDVVGGNAERDVLRDRGIQKYDLLRDIRDCVEPRVPVAGVKRRLRRLRRAPCQASAVRERARRACFCRRRSARRNPTSVPASISERHAVDASGGRPNGDTTHRRGESFASGVRTHQPPDRTTVASKFGGARSANPRRCRRSRRAPRGCGRTPQIPAGPRAAAGKQRKRGTQGVATIGLRRRCRGSTSAAATRPAATMHSSRYRGLAAMACVLACATAIAVESSVICAARAG